MKSKINTNQGIDWRQEKSDREHQRSFEDEYSEIHVKTTRIVRPPREGDYVGANKQEARIQSDGEKGRLVTLSHTELIQCDCGCRVDDILKTVRDSSGKLLCEKHSGLFCRLCSAIITPGEQVKIGENYYHRKNCAERIVESVLLEAEYELEKINPVALGELKALRSSLRAEKRSVALKKLAKTFGWSSPAGNSHALQKID